MNRMIVPTVAISLLIIATMACGPTARDTQATVDAAVAATGTAEAGADTALEPSKTPTTTPDAQATAEAATATDTAETAEQPEAEATPEPTIIPAPSPTPSVEEYIAMTEQELAALIDEAVQQAVAVTEGIAEVTEEIVVDEMITEEEVEAVEVTVVDAEEAITYAEELLFVYAELYGDLAVETIELLLAVEDDLDEMVEYADDIYDSLDEIESYLEQGLELTEETIAQLETAAQAASERAAEAQEQNQAWIEGFQAELEERVLNSLDVQPDEIATGRREAILSAFDYADAVQQSLDDSKVSQSELAVIAQLGANAGASLEAFGGAQLGQLSGSIDDLTAQVARGQIPQAQSSLGSFQASLPERPSRR